MRPIFIFDLDDTTVDSTHRQRLNSDGSIDLGFWRRMNTPANILRDVELPLAQSMRDAIARGLDVVIMTSRVMTHADRVWLNQRGLLAPVILSRDVNDDRSTGPYKLAKMADLAMMRDATLEQLAKRVIMWDDCKNVQLTLKNAGFRVIDPVKFNQTKAEKIA